MEAECWKLEGWDPVTVNGISRNFMRLTAPVGGRFSVEVKSIFSVSSSSLGTKPAEMS
jgi:hypothetical protein